MGIQHLGADLHLGRGLRGDAVLSRLPATQSGVVRIPVVVGSLHCASCLDFGLCPGTDYISTYFHAKYSREPLGYLMEHRWFEHSRQRVFLVEGAVLTSIRLDYRCKR